ncbi:hypothetical protein BDV06DRAFT_228850 [Aspergillus oleicola]
MRVLIGSHLRSSHLLLGESTADTTSIHGNEDGGFQIPGTGWVPHIEAIRGVEGSVFLPVGFYIDREEDFGGWVESESVVEVPADKGTQSYIAWHIEYACFVLFQDIIRNPHHLQAHLLPIDSALTCLSKFSDARIAPRVKRTIEKLRAKILELVAQRKESHTATRTTTGRVDHQQQQQQQTYVHPESTTANQTHTEKGATSKVASEQQAAPVTQDPLLYAGVQDDLARSLCFPPHQLMDEDFALLGNVDFEQVFLRTGDYNIGFEAIPAEPFGLSNFDASFSLPFLDGNI